MHLPLLSTGAKDDVDAGVGEHGTTHVAHL